MPFKAWECSGCGRIETPWGFVKITQSKWSTPIRIGSSRQIARRKRELILRLARTSPREGRWETGYRALQTRAVERLGKLERHDAAAAVSE